MEETSCSEQGQGWNTEREVPTVVPVTSAQQPLSAPWGWEFDQGPASSSAQEERTLLRLLVNPSSCNREDVTMSTSPNKPIIRLIADPSTAVALPLPPSPDKSRVVRRLASHQQLSSQSSLIGQQRQNQQYRFPLTAKASKDNLNQTQPPNAVLNTTTRTRSNSELPMPMERPRSSRKLAIPTTHARKSSLEVALREGPGRNAEESLAALRHSVLTSRVEAGKEGMSDYRIYLWLVLLNISAEPTDDYLKLVHRGRSPAYEKIKNDTFRTLATDTLFKRRVTDASITRVLNSVAWKLHDTHKNDTDSALYVQGMNVLSAPFLYSSRSESEAFALFYTFVTRECPGYIRGAMEGVHKGVALVDKCLEIINPTLANFLLSNNLSAKIYAFSSVLTFCACTPPLPEVLHLWDFLFAYGPHLNILCIVAQLLMLKDALMDSPSPTKLLRSLPALDAKEIIGMTLVVIRKIPDDVYAELVEHAK